MAASLPVLFAGGLAAAVVIDYGIKSIKGAAASSQGSSGPSSSPTSSGSSSTGGGTTTTAGGKNQTIGGAGSLAPGASGTLDPNAQTFAKQLQADTGLNPAVIAGWIMGETSGHITSNGDNNWLNVGSFDDGFQGGGSNVWSDPVTAADATASWMMGHPVNGTDYQIPGAGYGTGVGSAILGTVGQSVESQVNAIQSSGWASGHYGYALMSDVEQFLGH